MIDARSAPVRPIMACGSAPTEPLAALSAAHLPAVGAAHQGPPAPPRHPRSVPGTPLAGGTLRYPRPCV